MITTKQLKELVEDYILQRDLATPTGEVKPAYIVEHITKQYDDSKSSEELMAFDDGYDAGYVQAFIDITLKATEHLGEDK